MFDCGQDLGGFFTYQKPVFNCGLYFQQNFYFSKTFDLLVINVPAKMLPLTSLFSQSLHSKYLVFTYDKVSEKFDKTIIIF